MAIEVGIAVLAGVAAHVAVIITAYRVGLAAWLRCLSREAEYGHECGLGVGVIELAFTLVVGYCLVLVGSLVAVVVLRRRGRSELAGGLVAGLLGVPAQCLVWTQMVFLATGLSNPEW